MDIIWQILVIVDGQQAGLGLVAKVLILIMVINIKSLVQFQQE
jgi:hypothetical protein